MSLKYTCPGCGTPLGYDGLCWKWTQPRSGAEMCQVTFIFIV